MIPVLVYRKPHGPASAGTIPVHRAPLAARVTPKVALLRQFCEIAVEHVGGGLVAVCLDDGEFDYRYELVPTHRLDETVLRLVLEFDPSDYERAKAHHEESA